MYRILKENKHSVFTKITHEIGLTNNFRALEDFVTWVDTSKVRQHVMEYQDLRDDYEVHC